MSEREEKARQMTWRTRITALAQWIFLGALVGVFCGAASALFLILLIRSGIEILASHPRLYWNDGCAPKSGMEASV